MTQENKTIKRTLLYRLILFNFMLTDCLKTDDNRTRYRNFVEWVCPRNQARGIMGRRTLNTNLLVFPFIQGKIAALPV